jgi:hypothetical protein
MNTNSFVCEVCGYAKPIERVGLGMNIGRGPEYICDTCAPHATKQQAIAEIEAVIRAVTS